MFSVTESFVKRGEFNADQLWTVYKARAELGPDGEAYSKTGYGASLFATLLYALALALPGDVGLAQTTLLTSSIVIASTGALVFLAARRLRFQRATSVITALLFGLATPAYVYAKQFWSEPYALFTLFATFYLLRCFRDEQHPRDALGAGITLGLAVATRLTNAALVPLFAWYGFADWRNWLTRRGLVLFGLALSAIALTIAYYNWARYGNPLTTGYRADETFDNPILLGAYGLLFSPGKGLFVYVPFLATLAFAALAFFRRARRETIFISILFTFYVLLFSAWYYWWGGTNWGPRFLVPTLPFLILLSAPAVELAIARPSGLFARVFFVLGLLALAFQLLGVAVPSLAYRARMTKLSPYPDWDAIFLPTFSPLVGSVNLLRPRVLDFAWLKVIGDVVTIDWLVLVLTLGVIVVCAVGLSASFQRGADYPHRSSVIGRWPSVIGMAIVLAALTLFSLYRYRADPRWGGSEGYRALLQTVARQAQPRDVLILNDDTRTPFFLNENRARIRWYGLSRDPRHFDEASRALLTRLTQQYARVWLAFDDAVAQLPDPTREWLDQSLRRIVQQDFEDGVHLILYETAAP